MRRSIIKKRSFQRKQILLFLLASLLISSPFIYRFLRISDAYIDSDVRKQTLNSIFFLRNEYGLTIADLTITNIEADQDYYMITVLEKYHGYLKKHDYEELNMEYLVRYDRKNNNFSIEKITEK